MSEHSELDEESPGINDRHVKVAAVQPSKRSGGYAYWRLSLGLLPDSERSYSAL